VFGFNFPELAISGWFALLRSNLSPRKLKALLTQSSANRGLERYRRAGITASSSFIAKVLNIFISFLSVPLTIHYLGSERYGVWLTISSLLTWMTLTDFGLSGSALVNVLAESSGNDDFESGRQYASSAFWALSCISLIAAVVAAISFHWISWAAVFRVSAAVPTHELNTACAVTLAIFILNFPLSLQYSIYSAYQDGYLANIWSISSNAFSLLALVVVSRFHGGMPQLIFALSGTRTLVAIANNFYLFRRYRWLIPYPSAVRWSCVKRLFKLGGKYMITQLAALGIYQSQPMIITQMLGPASVVIFVVSYKILTLPMDLIYMATQPFIAAFGEAKARQDWEWIWNAYKRATWVSTAVGFFMVALMVCIAKPLIRLWASSAAVPTTSFILWLSIYVMMGIALMPTNQFLSGLEKVTPLAVSTTLCAIGVVSGGILLAHGHGLVGLAMAMAFSKLITFWPIQLYEVYRLKRAFRPDVLEGAGQLAKTAPDRREVRDGQTTQDGQTGPLLIRQSH
jgi:O-antigen/teichoic acid export membrane protein